MAITAVPRYCSTLMHTHRVAIKLQDVMSLIVHCLALHNKDKVILIYGRPME